AYLREYANFDIVDDRMVLDGCLSRYRILALWEGTMADQETLDKIKAWVNEGGVLLAYDFGKVTNLEGDISWHNDLFGYVQMVARARVRGRYSGRAPPQYRMQVGDPESADYLDDGWYPSEMDETSTRRWTRQTASLRIPVNPVRQYLLRIRAFIPEEAV